MKWCVVGFGVSGRALCEALLKQGEKPAVLEKDTRKWDRKFEEKGVEFFEDKKQLKSKFPEVRFLLSSSVKHDEFVKDDFISELDFVLEKIKDRAIIITGTKGKGSTVYFSYLMLSSLGQTARVGGNMGWDFPVESMPAGLLPLFPADVFVIEASSFQLRSTFKHSPFIFAVTTLTEDHLDWHPSEDDYRISKLKVAFFAPKVVLNWYVLDYFFTLFKNPAIYENLDLLITLNTDKASTSFIKESVKKIAELRRMKNVSFIWIDDDNVFQENGQSIETFKFPREKFEKKFKGPHWIDNALVAFAVSSIWARRKGIKIPKDIFEKFVEKAQPQKYSMENEGVFEYKGKKVTVFNDSKSTNPLALTRALSSFDKEVVLICGGDEKDMKGISWYPYRFQFARKVKFAVILSNKNLRKYFLQSVVEENLEDAVKKAFEVAKDGDVILFSPGCASLSSFSSSKERGEIFSAILRKIAKKVE